MGTWPASRRPEGAQDGDGGDGGPRRPCPWQPRSSDSSHKIAACSGDAASAVDGVVAAVAVVGDAAAADVNVGNGVAAWPPGVDFLLAEVLQDWESPMAGDSVGGPELHMESEPQD